MSKKIFISATGTDVGKTYISALIIKKMRESGYNCGYYKPVLSGGNAQNGKLVESDANYVIQSAKIPCVPEDCVSFWWREAVSPHLAAARAERIIDPEKIKTDFTKISQNYDYLLVEGAGGITCPLNLNVPAKYLLSDLIRELNLSTIIVADAGLGTINSTLLTVEYARGNGIRVEGIILNNYDAQNFMHRDNRLQIEYLAGTPVIACVPANATNIALLEKHFQ